MAASSGDSYGPLELLVIQPTPFCNINCSYCYLANRQATQRMSMDTLEQAFRWIFSSGLVRQPFTLLWHAGEPLVLPVAFYEQAGEILDRVNVEKIPVLQSFQSNATLLDEEWCKFLNRPGYHLGVSVDGPAFLHDRHRRTRGGQGTLDRVLRGIHLLHQHGVPVQVITVLTADSLDYPDELFDFYQSHGISSVGFNVEEVEGPHAVSSLQRAGTPERFRRFLARFLALAHAADPPLSVREFESSAAALNPASRYGPGSRTQENRPWAIVNVDCEGNFGTYSPELLDAPSAAHGGFVLGHVATDTLEMVTASARFQSLEREIAAGVETCRRDCDYYPFCGGGAPANKFFENQSFATSETLSCRLHKKISLDVTLDILERRV